MYLEIFSLKAYQFIYLDFPKLKKAAADWGGWGIVGRETNIKEGFF